MKNIETGDSTNEFILRRLHSLVGIVPLTFFVIFHISMNSFALHSAEHFNWVVNTLRSFPHLELLEIVMLGVPFLFHGVYGMIISPKMNRAKVSTYNQIRNWTYFFQRVTGIATFLFLVAHIYTLRFVEHLDFDYMAVYFSNPWWTVAYIIGVSSAIYHLANGLWNFCISWGITVGEDAQKRMGVFCLVIGVALWILSMADIYAFLK